MDKIDKIDNLIRDLGDIGCHSCKFGLTSQLEMCTHSDWKKIFIEALEDALQGATNKSCSNYERG